MAWTNHVNAQWIIDKIDDSTINWTKEFAEYLASDKDGTSKLTTSQLRKFFGKLRQIEADFDQLKTQIPMLKPKLAYAVGRDKDKTKVRAFYNEISSALTAVQPDNKATFKNLVSLVESIVAYHKFFGGV
ncbi:MAG: type III-A CRISPR-associated protein Csm2 [Bacteroidales bacterium]|nr:type III-A CRISPR-associated protein Csm2 [Bacteroidales bacterium]